MTLLLDDIKRAIANKRRLAELRRAEAQLQANRLLQIQRAVTPSARWLRRREKRPQAKK